ncbi:MAG: YajQ family cyclic di-GMP-binding protein [Actinomycetota bacterium]
MADSSFDVVSKVDTQELDNAVNQAAREVGQRFDFRNVGAAVSHTGDTVEMRANSAERVLAVLDVLKEKLVKRGVSLKALEVGEPRPSGKEFRLTAQVRQGISPENAKKLAALIRAEGPKGVQAQVQGDQLRVSAKKKDDLQAVMALLRGADLDFPVQFTNYR